MKPFAKANLAALLATVVDFGTLTAFVELLGGFYPYGVALGAFMGAITNFLVNRYWSFDAAHQHFGKQAFRYALVSAGSLILNTVGVYLVTEKTGLFYLVSKVIIAISVGLFFNYPLHRHFVYPLERRKAPRMEEFV